MFFTIVEFILRYFTGKVKRIETVCLRKDVTSDQFNIIVSSLLFTNKIGIIDMPMTVYSGSAQYALLVLIKCSHFLFCMIRKQNSIKKTPYRSILKMILKNKNIAFVRPVFRQILIP